jgi:exosortase/archaeosortase family protein
VCVRSLIALSSIPVAVIANGARVAGTGIASDYVGPAAAEGFFHEFSGWMVFVAAFAMMIIIQRAVLLVSPRPHASSGPAVRAA